VFGAENVEGLAEWAEWHNNWLHESPVNALTVQKTLSVKSSCFAPGSSLGEREDCRIVCSVLCSICVL
jgi:hypothetical protein